MFFCWKSNGLHQAVVRLVQKGDLDQEVTTIQQSFGIQYNLYIKKQKVETFLIPQVLHWVCYFRWALSRHASHLSFKKCLSKLNNRKSCPNEKSTQTILTFHGADSRSAKSTPGVPMLQSQVLKNLRSSCWKLCPCNQPRKILQHISMLPLCRW